MKDNAGNEIHKEYKIDQEDQREETLIKREENYEKSNDCNDNDDDVIQCNGTKA